MTFDTSAHRGHTAPLSPPPSPLLNSTDNTSRPVPSDVGPNSNNLKVATAMSADDTTVHSSPTTSCTDDSTLDLEALSLGGSGRDLRADAPSPRSLSLRSVDEVMTSVDASQLPTPPSLSASLSSGSSSSFAASAPFIPAPVSPQNAAAGHQNQSSTTGTDVVAGRSHARRLDRFANNLHKAKPYGRPTSREGSSKQRHSQVKEDAKEAMRELRRQINKMAVGFILSGSDEEHMIDTAGDVNPDSFSSAPLSSPMEDVAENADDMERQIASMQISAERGEVDHSAPIGVDAEEDTLKEILFKPVEIPVSKLLPDVHAFPDIFTVKPRVLFAPVEIRHQSVITLAEVFPPYWSGPLFSGNAFADVFASDTFPSSFPQAGNAADSYGGFGTYGVPENTGETQDVCMGLADSSSEADVDDAMDFDTEDDITTFKSSIHGLRSHSIFGSAHPAPLPHQLAATTSAFGSSAPGHTNQTCTSQQSGFAAFATSSGNAFSAYSQSAPGNNYLSRAGSQSGFGAFANGSNGNGFSSYGQSALGYNYLSSAGLQTGFGQSAGYNPTTYDNYPGSPMPIDEPMSWGHSSSHAHQADEEMGSPMLVDEDLIPFDSYQSANQVDSNEESPMLIDLDLVPSASPDTPDSDTPSGSSKEQPAPSTPDVPLVPAPSKLESIMKLDPESRAGRALRSLKRQSFPSTPLFESYDGPVTEGAVRTLTEWVYDITGPSEFAAPESELAKLRLVMPLYSKKVIDALSTRLRGYRPGRQTVKALEVVYWLEEDAASMRALIRNCESGSVVAAREIATRITMNLDKTAPIKGYTPTSRAEIRSASVATSQAGGVPNPRPDSETDRDAQGQGKAAKRRMEVQGRR